MRHIWHARLQNDKTSARGYIFPEITHLTENLACSSFKTGEAESEHFFAHPTTNINEINRTKISLGGMIKR